MSKFQKTIAIFLLLSIEFQPVFLSKIKYIFFESDTCISTLDTCTVTLFLINQHFLSLLYNHIHILLTLFCRVRRRSLFHLNDLLHTMIMYYTKHAEWDDNYHWFLPYESKPFLLLKTWINVK